MSGKEYLVYSAGRYIVMLDMQTQNQRIIANPEDILSIYVREKLCLVGIIGKTVLLWDLEF